MQKPEREPAAKSQPEDNGTAQGAEPSTDKHLTDADLPIKNQKIHHRLLADKRLLAGLTLVIVLIAGTAVYWFIVRDNNKKIETSQTNPKAKASAKPDNSQKPNLPSAVLINGNTYFSSVKILPDLHLFSDDTVANAAEFSNISYYQIGTTKAKQSIVVAEYSVGPGVSKVFFLGDSQGSYTALLRMDPQYQGYPDTSLAQTVTQDKTTRLNDVNFPKNVTVANQKLSTKSYSNDGSDFGLGIAGLMESGLPTIRASALGGKTPVNPQKIADKDGFSYYRVLMGDSTLYKSEEIYAVFNNIFSVRYDPAGEIASSNDKLAIKWSAGESNVSQYFSGGKGCGNNGYIMALGLSDSQLTPVGKTPGGQAVYQLPGSNSLVQDIYNKDYSNGEFLNDDSLKNLSVEQMTDKHAYFIAKNGFGENVVFQRDDMFNRGGCAKPVIYLYPQKTQNISVKVGAQITKSDPFYTKSGWQNVTAQPNGTLTYNTKQYNSLYWEGYGLGSYPDITWGTIVKTTDAKEVVLSQLTQQGLKPNEVKDFMDFWGPKLTAVEQPYTRISWLNTQLMNSLAPLNINPTPQTSIRIFLDFEGLDEPQSLPHPKLTAPKRTGFTVVEWGGLMRNGLN